MRLWKRASGALKDQTSIWQANLTRRTALRNPDIEKAVIRATNHHDLSFDKRSVDRVCEWLSISPYNLKPILWSVSNRVEKTRSWVVALKALYLMHVLTNSKISCVKQIGRLPFDLANFSCLDSKAWPLNAFIRTYYAFLDQKSTVIFQHAEEKREGLMQELILLQKLQSLIDLLMQIKPQSTAASVPLILHVMDGVIVEIYDVYSRICRGIAIVLMNIYSANKTEATMALNIVQKATQQGEDLSYYFEFCQEIGVVNACDEFPVVNRIPDEGIFELEQIIEGFNEEEKVINVVVVDDDDEGKKDYSYRDGFRTIITDKWEKFEEDYVVKNPFASPVKCNHEQEPPDLMTFL